MPKRTGAIVAVVVAVWLAGCASVDTAAPRDVTGKWIGQCQNCPVRRFTLVIAQRGEQLTGTLQASPRTGLGEAEMPLVDGTISGRTITFQTKTADGIPFKASLRVSGDGKTLDGQAQHRAAFPVWFTREP